jgi:lipopolysaccharide biosynthesis glycosyltransferase
MDLTFPHQDNRPARHEQAIYFCVDRKFYPFALFLADQIARKSPTRDFDLCIISQDELPEHPLWDELDLRVCRFDTRDLTSHVPSDSRISFAAYLRILAPIILAKDYHRMLYLDADMFYQRGDLSRLLSLDIKGYPVAAVRDMIQLRKPHRVPKDFKPFGLGYARYFNSGLLLIDVDTYNSERVGHRAIDFAIKNASKILCHDQTSLDAVLHGRWAELSLVWNYEFSHQTNYFSSMFDVCIYHFIGRRKPFGSRYGGFPRRFINEYRYFFEERWPDASIDIQKGLDIRNHKLEHVLCLGFHILNAHRFLPLDEKYRSDWDVFVDDTKAA